MNAKSIQIVATRTLGVLTPPEVIAASVRMASRETDSPVKVSYCAMMSRAFITSYLITLTYHLLLNLLINESIRSPFYNVYK